MDWKKWPDEIPEPNKLVLIRKKDKQVVFCYQLYMFMGTCDEKTLSPASNLNITHWCYIDEPVNEHEQPLPCPFCGSLDLVERKVYQEDFFYIVCKDCEACGPTIEPSNFNHTDESVRIWNKRNGFEEKINGTR